MVVVLIAWVVLALLLGTLIGTAIHRADAVQFPDREERAWWEKAPSAPVPGAAVEPPSDGRSDPLAA